MKEINNKQASSKTDIWIKRGYANKHYYNHINQRSWRFIKIIKNSMNKFLPINIKM